MRCAHKVAWIGAFCASVLTSGVHAQAYPVKPVRFLVGFAAGGATDVSARMLAQRLAESLGQPVVVENRPGSGGVIATEAVSKAVADGYTLLMMPAADAVQPALRRKLPYDLERDFNPRRDGRPSPTGASPNGRPTWPGSTGRKTPRTTRRFATS